MKSEGAQWNAEGGGGWQCHLPDSTIIFYPIPKGNEGDR